MRESEREREKERARESERDTHTQMEKYSHLDLGYDESLAERQTDRQADGNKDSQEMIIWYFQASIPVNYGKQEVGMVKW